MKRILILCILLVVSAYLVVSATLFNREPGNQVCKGIELTIKDSIDYDFITLQGINQILKRQTLERHQRAPNRRSSYATSVYC